MNDFEQKRLEKLDDMLKWRMREGANGHQQAEAESLAWAIGIIKSFFNEDQIEVRELYGEPKRRSLFRF